jgi:hypothetical protein
MKNGQLFMLGLLAALAASAIRPITRWAGLPL